MRCQRLVVGVRIKGSTDTTIGNSRTALTVTASADWMMGAPEPSVVMTMICAGPAQTKIVLSSVQSRLKCESWASAQIPREVAKSTAARIVDETDLHPCAKKRNELFHCGESSGGSGMSR